MSLRNILLTTTFLSIVFLMASPVMAADVEDDIAVLKEENAKLQKSLARLMSRLNQLEKKTDQTAATAAKAEEKAEETATKAVTKADDGSFQLPGGTKVKIGGYAKLDVIHDLSGRSTTSGDSNASDTTNMAGIPVSSSTDLGRRNNVTRVHARQTRLNLATSTPSSWGDVKTYFEIDFFGTAGSAMTNNPHAPRLRHAYVNFGNWLIGQSYTTFADLSLIGNTIDFTGPVSTFGVRQAQIRYTSDLGDGHSVAVAVENPESDFTDSLGTTNSNSISRYPDLVAKWRYEGKDGHIGLSGVLRNIGYDSGATGTGALGDKHVWGYGLALTGKWKPFTDENAVYAKDNVLLQVLGGDGIGRYLTEAVNTGAAVNRNTGEMKSQFAYGGYAGYQHYWADSLRSYLAYGIVGVDVEDYLLTTSTKRVDSFHANLIWSPISSLDVGIEYIHGRRKVESGDKGELNRIQGSVKYSF